MSAGRRSGESLEAAARRIRYDFLETVRRDRDARYLATGHHRDDQLETILLRLAHGSGLTGLGGIPAVRTSIVRPLLSLGRSELAAALAGEGLEPTDDPGNLDPAVPRNRLRHLVLPRLLADDPGLPTAARRLADTARRAAAAIERRLEGPLGIASTRTGASLAAPALIALPEPLWPFALALLHRRSGLPYPPRSSAVADLRRQFQRGEGVGCDCGGGWSWRLRSDRLWLAPGARRPCRPVGLFAYTLTVPGEMELPEISARFRMRREQVAPWMFRGSPRRAGLALDLARGDRITIRNRRPGDRIQPLGCGYERKLKDVLIDREVPRPERDRLPLLCLNERIVWVPGVTIDDRHKIADESSVWVAELERPATHDDR